MTDCAVAAYRIIAGERGQVFKSYMGIKTF